MIIAWGHVSTPEKYECVIWKVCTSLFAIDDESVLWLWMRGVMGGLRLGGGLKYQLINKRISMTKSCIDGERVWFLMGV